MTFSAYISNTIQVDLRSSLKQVQFSCNPTWADLLAGGGGGGGGGAHRA
jgi:hypothetical protein